MFRALDKNCIININHVTSSYLSSQGGIHIKVTKEPTTKTIVALYLTASVLRTLTRIRQYCHYGKTNNFVHYNFCSDGFLISQ